MNPSAEGPLWRQIYRSLAGEIQRGIHRPGERLPTETALATRFAVNRHTVRRAMAALADAGLVRVEQGRGTFVQEDVIDYPVSRRTRFSDIVIGADREPHSRLIRDGEMPASPEVATALGLADGTPVVFIETVHAADERPLSVDLHYFPAARYPHLLRDFTDTGSITRALFAAGTRDYFRDVIRVYTRLPDAHEAHHLQQARSQPVLVGHTVNVDPEGRPIEYAIGRYAGQRVRLVFSP